MRKKTKQEFISEFLQLAESGGDLRSSKLKGSWRTHIKRNFGDYSTMLKELGYDFEEIHGSKNWDKAKVIKCLKERNELGKPMNPGAVKLDDTPLRGACESYFGTVNNALKAAGFDIWETAILKTWNRELIKQEFLTFIKNKPNSSILSLSRNYKALDHAIRKHYETYEALCEDLGVDVSIIKRQEHMWSGEALLDVLRNLRDSGQSLNISTVLQYFPSAYEVAKRNFGSYENALKEIGENYLKYVEPLNINSYYGRTFEKLVKDMFIDLGYVYTYQKQINNGELRPDFVDEKTNEFLDTKLSSWTLFHSSTPEKYLPICSKLTIIYLRGKDIPHDYPRTDLRHISYYYDKLKEKDLTHYIEKFGNLHRQVEELSTTKKEAV